MPAPRHNRAVLGITAGAALLIGSSTAMATAAPSNNGSDGTSADAETNPSGCNALPKVGDRWVGRSGDTDAAPTDPNAIHEVSFQASSGRVWTESLPSAAFDPATASQSTLRAFGLPTRPTDPAALSTWLTEVGRWDPVSTGLCEVPGAPHYGQANSVWSGLLSDHGASHNVVIAVQGTWKSPSRMLKNGLPTNSTAP